MNGSSALFQAWKGLEGGAGSVEREWEFLKPFQHVMELFPHIADPWAHCTRVLQDVLWYLC